MATQETTIHPFPAQARVTQIIPIAVYELKLFPLTVQPKRLHGRSTPLLIVPSPNHSQPQVAPRRLAPPTGGRARSGRRRDDPEARNTHCEEPI